MPKTIGKGRGKPTPPSAGVLSVTGSLGAEPFQSGGAESYSIKGAGFQPNVALWYNLANPGCCLGSYVITDAAGAFTLTRLTGTPGTYWLRLYSYTTPLVFLTGISFVVE